MIRNIFCIFLLALTTDDGSTMHLTNNQTSAYQMITKAAIS
jgi:hypothetical protein